MYIVRKIYVHLLKVKYHNKDISSTNNNLLHIKGEIKGYKIKSYEKVDTT